MQAAGHISVRRQRISSAMIKWIPEVDPECQLGLKSSLISKLIAVGGAGI
jgi:hypothetical protein